jgi:pimeloyl-ACP methyl ester carboxylesterase
MRKVLFFCILILFVVGVVLFLPARPAVLASYPAPLAGYTQALARIESILANEGSSFNPVCRLQFMDHGARTDKVIVMMHGYTSCPEQFRQLGEAFYDQGYNVLIAPLPHHGLANRMTNEQEQLTAKELAKFADQMIDIAQGLGQQVTIMGLSGGGVIAAWAAQNRTDLDRAVIVSPGFGYHQIPTLLTIPAMNFFRIWPNYYQWWEPAQKEDSLPAYAYPRYASHALAEILAIGSAVKVSACRETPASKAILVITNANDPSVNNELTAQVVQCWQAHNAPDVRTYEFNANLKLGHDIISPDQPGQRIEIVYPVLIALVTH